MLLSLFFLDRAVLLQNLLKLQKQFLTKFFFKIILVKQKYKKHLNFFNFILLMKMSMLVKHFKNLLQDPYLIYIKIGTQFYTKVSFLAYLKKYTISIKTSFFNIKKRFTIYILKSLLLLKKKCQVC